MDLQKPSKLAQELKSNLMTNINDMLMHCSGTSTVGVKTAIKTFHYYGTGVQSCFKVIKQFLCVSSHILLMSPCSRNFL